jgi:hypothetical protein
MSTLAAVNETLLDIKGQLVRNNTKLDRVAAVKPMPSGPRDLTERERTGQTSAEAAREGLKERAGAKPTGTGVGGLIDKVPSPTGNRGLDLAALAGLVMLTWNRDGLAPPNLRAPANKFMLNAILFFSYSYLYLKLTNYFTKLYSRSYCNKIKLNKIN